jgi:hypothetical protein
MQLAARAARAARAAQLQPAKQTLKPKPKPKQQQQQQQQQQRATPKSKSARSSMLAPTEAIHMLQHGTIVTVQWRDKWSDATIANWLAEDHHYQIVWLGCDNKKGPTWDEVYLYPDAGRPTRDADAAYDPKRPLWIPPQVRGLLHACPHPRARCTMRASAHAPGALPPPCPACVARGLERGARAARQQPPGGPPARHAHRGDAADREAAEGELPVGDSPRASPPQNG